MASEIMDSASKEHPSATNPAPAEGLSQERASQASPVPVGTDAIYDFYFDPQLKLWRSSRIMTWGLLLFAVFSFVMGLAGLLRGDLIYAGVLFSCSAVSCMGLIVAIVAGYKTYAKWYFSVPILILFFFLVLHGGVEQTGLYWCIALTPGMLYIVGPRVGVLVFAAMLLATGVIFYGDLYPWPERYYSSAHEIRFLLTLTATALFSLGHDYVLIKSGFGDADWVPGKIENR